MNPLEVAESYFDAWNRRDAAAVLATFTAEGTYSDPTTGGRLRGAALAGYMNELWAAFPDLSFEVASVGVAGPELVAAQWIMRGTNRGRMMGLPPSGRAVTLPGADFIRVAGDRIAAVDGYFDSRALPEQLGLEITVQPKQIGPYAFGTAVRVSSGSEAKPGAFSVTALQARSREDVAAIGEETRHIANELVGMKGFIALVAVTVGMRMMTLAAWEGPDDPKQLLRDGRHAAAMKRFFGTELGGGGVTSVWVPERIGPRWVRCAACQKMVNVERYGGKCECGAALAAPLAYW